MKSMTLFGNTRTENREQRTENREQRTENREQRTENREQRTEGGRKHYKHLTLLSASLVPLLIALTFFAGDCNSPTPIPSVPSGLTATAVSTTQINLSWTAVANATKYNLFDGTTQIGGDITTTTYSHTGLAGSTTHSYTLKACNSGGCSAASGAVIATTDFKVTATEHPRGAGIRDRYGVFDIVASETITDYRLAIVKASDPAPSSNALEAGSHIKRNIGTTSKYVLISYALSASLTGTATISALLQPSVKYAVYGMKAGGTPSKLLEFNTDAVITSAITSVKTRYMDSSISYITISARVGEKLIMPSQFQFDMEKFGYAEASFGSVNFTINSAGSADLSIYPPDGSIYGTPVAEYKSTTFILMNNYDATPDIGIRTLYYDATAYNEKTGDKNTWNYTLGFSGHLSPKSAPLWTIKAE